MGEQSNQWKEWIHHVLAELERLGACDVTNAEAIVALRIEVAMLKVKSSVWGFLAGAIPAVVVIIYMLLKGKI